MQVQKKSLSYEFKDTIVKLGENIDKNRAGTGRSKK